MEIDVTDYVLGTEHGDISSSCAELGPNAAQITWSHATAESARVPILASAEDCDAARDWLRGFGAWSRDELAAESDDEIRALVLQFISGDVREAESLAPGDGPGGIDWEAYGELQSEGTCSGYLYLGVDGRIYFGMH